MSSHNELAEAFLGEDFSIEDFRELFANLRAGRGLGLPACSIDEVMWAYLDRPPSPRADDGFEAAFRRSLREVLNERVARQDQLEQEQDQIEHRHVRRGSAQLYPHFARYDPAHAFTDGLFRPLKRGERKKSKLDVTYVQGHLEFRFTGFEPLGTDDLQVLLAVLALTGLKSHGKFLNPHSDSQEGRALWAALRPEGDASQRAATVVSTSLYTLLRIVGWKDGGSKRRQVMQSLDRLAAVRLFVRDLDNGWKWSTHLLSHAVNEQDGRLLIAANCHLARGVFGENHFVMVSLLEQRQLKSEPAMILHCWLSAWVRPGQHSRPINIDTLAGHIWPNDCDEANARKRRMKVRQVLGEIGQLSTWRVDNDGNTAYRFTRARLLPTPSPEA